jgi:hypothetical protein
MGSIVAMPHPGQPTKYDASQHPTVARQLTGTGKTLADLAEVFGVARATIIEWMSRHLEFSVAIKLGREDATDRVERALFERATGYTHKSEKLMVVSDGGQSGSHVERHETTEHYAPDTNAARLWLMNMRAGAWKDKQSLEHSGPNGQPIQVVTGVPIQPAIEAPAQQHAIAAPIIEASVVSVDVAATTDA